MPISAIFLDSRIPLEVTSCQATNSFSSSIRIAILKMNCCSYSLTFSEYFFRNRYNSIKKKKSRLRAGFHCRNEISKSSNTSATGSFTYYTVQDGDTLSDVAHNYNISWLDIKEANVATKLQDGSAAFPGLHSGQGWTIYPADRLRIPNSKIGKGGMITSSMRSEEVPVGGEGEGGTGLRGGLWVLPVALLLLGWAGFRSLQTEAKRSPQEDKEDLPAAAQPERELLVPVIEPEEDSTPIPNKTELEPLKSITQEDVKPEVPAAKGTIATMPEAEVNTDLAWQAGPAGRKKLRRVRDQVRSTRSAPAAGLIPRLSPPSPRAQDLPSVELAASLQARGLTQEELAAEILTLRLPAQKLPSLLQELNMSASSIAGLLSELRLDAEERDNLISALHLSPEDFATVLSALSLPVDSLASLVLSQKLSPVDVALILPALMLPRSELGLLLSKLDLSPLELAVLLKRLNLSPDELSLTLLNLGLSIQDFPKLAQSLSVSELNWAKIFDSIGLTSCKDLESFLQTPSLSFAVKENVISAVIAPDFDLFTRKEIAQILPSLRLSGSKMTDLLCGLKLSPDELAEVLPVFKFNFLELKTVLGNLKRSQISPTDLAPILRSLKLTPLELGDILNGLKLSADEVDEVVGLCARQLAPLELAKLLGSLKLPADRFCSTCQTLGISAQDSAAMLPSLRFSPKDLASILPSLSFQPQDLAILLPLLSTNQGGSLQTRDMETVLSSLDLDLAELTKVAQPVKHSISPKALAACLIKINASGSDLVACFKTLDLSPIYIQSLLLSLKPSDEDLKLLESSFSLPGTPNNGNGASLEVSPIVVDQESEQDFFSRFFILENLLNIGKKKIDKLTTIFSFYLVFMV
mmetsp:Transcript_27926/g.38613  ORF Transcript_27926/g.38613 Transcript_27926/m.38613 type:complete len:866 (-) Transcript_27926:143-2740(-)